MLYNTCNNTRKLGLEDNIGFYGNGDVLFKYNRMRDNLNMRIVVDMILSRYANASLDTYVSTDSISFFFCLILEDLNNLLVYTSMA